MKTAQIFSYIILYIAIIVNFTIIFLNIKEFKRRRKQREDLENEYSKMTKELQDCYFKALNNLEETSNCILTRPELLEFHDYFKNMNKQIFDVKLRIEIANLGIFTTNPTKTSKNS